MAGKGSEVVELRFFPGGSSGFGLVAKSPEDVATLGIGVYPASLDKVFGKGAGERYRAALRLQLAPKGKVQG